MTTRKLLHLSIAAGTLATLAYLGMVDETTAVIVYFVNGVAGMIANIATLALAADHCPRRSEGFAFAALMSVINLATPLHDTIGSLLYEHLFQQRLGPLIVVSAVLTAAIFLLMPLLPERSQ
jgi:MFS family permease